MKRPGWAVVMLGCANALALAGDEPKSGPERMFTCETIVRAPLAEVWRMWTTTEGLKSCGIPGANIDLRVGGPYEWYFAPDAPAGQKGAEGCTVLAYLPMKMIAFTWNAPPAVQALRDAGARTNVIVTFDELPGERVKIKLHQLGYGTGEDWDKYYAYFEKAWPHVLEAMQKSCAQRNGAPESASALGMAALEPLIGTWTTAPPEGGTGKGGMRVVYEWGLNKQVMHAKSFRSSDGVESPVYETTLSWHPKNKQYVFRSVSATGDMFDGVAEMVGNTVEWQWEGISGDKVTVYRQSQKLVGSDRYDWTVYVRNPDGWKQIMEATFAK